MLNRAELDARAARLAALRAEIGRAAGAALATQAATIPRYLMAALRVRSDEDVDPPIAANEGLDPGSAAVLGERGEGDRPGSGPPDVRLASDRGPRGRADRRSRRGPLARAPGRGEGRQGRTRRGARGTSSWPTSADRASGAGSSRTRRSARRRCGRATSSSGPEAARPIATFARGGAWAHSGHLSRRLQGTLRSPSFTIDRRFLHVLAAGRASRVNVVIEHFVMIQDPLYGRLRLILNDDGPRWQTFDLGMWKGRRAYLEFADTTTQDLHDMRPPAGCGPEGYVAVGRALLSDQGPPAMPATASSMGLLGDDPVDSPSALAGRYGRAVSESLAAMGDGSLARPARRRGPGRPARLARRARIAGPRRVVRRIGSARCSKSFREIEARLPEPRRAPAMTEGTPEDEHRLPPRQPEERRAGRPPPDDPGPRGRPTSRRPRPAAAGGWNSPGGSPTRPTR